MTKLEITVLFGTPEWQEGRIAAERRQSFRTDCPYLFYKMGCDQETFNRYHRQKMDAWFLGWTSWLDQHGLGFNFEPFRRARPPTRTSTP